MNTPGEAHQPLEHELLSCLESRHREEARVLEDVAYLADRHSFITAAKRFGGLRMRQELHLIREELLLELIEREDGPEALSTLREKSNAVRTLLAVTGQSLSRWNLEQFRAVRAELERALREHQRVERDVLLPALREAFGLEGCYQHIRALCKPA